jgi:anti-sigma-K factor RskA
VSISCEAARELLAAFVLNSLDTEEQRDVAQHLETCRLHDAELAELRTVIAALPLVADEVAPPRALKSRLLAEFEREAGPPEEAARGWSPLSWLRRPQLGFALAAGLALIAVGLGAWNLSLTDDSIAEHSLEQNGMVMRVLYLKEHGIAILDVELPAVSADRTYQAWRIPDEGPPESLGVIHNRGAFAFHTDLEDARAIAISIEPAGGSAQPTSAPVMVREL